MKKAVIDIGTNSVKLTLGEAAADGGARMICDMNVITKLGEGMRASGALSAEAMERTAQAVAKFAAFARAEGADEILCVGTMALRRARKTKEAAHRRPFFRRFFNFRRYAAAGVALFFFPVFTMKIQKRMTPAAPAVVIIGFGCSPMQAKTTKMRRSHGASSLLR